MRTSGKTIFTWLVFLIAFVICGVAWMRFFSGALLNPSPVRYVAFTDEGGDREHFNQRCQGPAFVQGDIVWRFCAYGSHPEDPWGLVQFDLRRGQAALLWPAARPQNAQVLSFVQSSAGDLAVAWGMPEVAGVDLVRRVGGITPLGMPPEVPGDLTAMTWRENTLELVFSTESSLHIVAHDGVRWSDPHAIPLPEICTAETLCTLQIATYTPGGWQFLYASAPPGMAVDPAGATNTESGTESSPTLDLLVMLEDGRITSEGQIALAELAPDFTMTSDDGVLTGIGVFFDRAPGGMVNWSVDGAPLRLYGSGWEATHQPEVEGGVSFYFSNYEITGTSLRWIPGIRFPQQAWLLDQWMSVRTTSDGMGLFTMTGLASDTLAQDHGAITGEPTQTCIVPAAEGGYWIMGADGAYLRASANMDRADGLTLLERIERVFASFGSLQPVQSDFYTEQSEIKVLALPLVLLSLPVGYLLVFFVRQTRRERSAWIGILIRVSLAYTVLALVFIWWFWETMRRF